MLTKIIALAVGAIALVLSLSAFSAIGELDKKYQQDHKLLSGVANRTFTTFLFINDTQIPIDNDIMDGMNSTELKHKYMGR